MNCIETRKNIEALLDDELDRRLKDAVESHLSVCAACCETKDEMILLSSFLRESPLAPPAPALDERVRKSFENHYSSKQPRWRRAVFGAFVVPKPVFAAFLIAAATASWLAFEFGKINSTTISLASPSVAAGDIPASIPAEPTIQIVTVEIPVVKEKTVTRAVYIRESKNKARENKSLSNPRQTNLPLSSSVAENGYFTDVNLKGFEPSAEMSAKIIKEVKEDEK